MGTPVVCVVVTLFFACHEVKHLTPAFAKQMMIFLWHIDDGIMIQKVTLNDPASMQAFEIFKKDINRNAALTFTALDHLSTVNFLDLTITVTKFYDIIFAPYSKSFYLYQCPLQYSAHPLGVLHSIIKGHLLTTWLH